MFQTLFEHPSCARDISYIFTYFQVPISTWEPQVFDPQLWVIQLLLNQPLFMTVVGCMVKITPKLRHMLQLVFIPYCKLLETATQ